MRIVLFRTLIAIAVGIVVIVGLAAPFSAALIDRFAREDVEARTRLIASSLHLAVDMALGSGEPDRLAAAFAEVARDPQIRAVGLCDASGTLVASTELLPAGLACEQVIQTTTESLVDLTAGGRRVPAAIFPLETGGSLAHLVIINDMQAAQTRSEQLRSYVFAGMFGIIAAAIGLALALVFIVLRGWLRSLRQAIEEIRQGRPAVATLRDSDPVIKDQVRKLIREIDAGRIQTEAAQADWSPQALHDFLVSTLPGAEVIVVSNREPYIHNHADEGIVVQTPASGLISALEPIVRTTGGVWIAHGSGSADRETVDRHDRIEVPPAQPSYSLRRIWLTDEEQDGYYYGFSNQGLWPLCHIAFVRPDFREQDWEAYKAINERFAEAVAQEARSEDPIVLVQDYHFALAPAMIRRRLPKATIITFWHIPWPNSEAFGICPWKEEIITGLLGSTVIGFHTQFHCNNFLETVDRFIESRIDREHATVTLAGQETLVRAYPISIEWPPRALAEQPSVPACRAELIERLDLPQDARIAVGIERFDYTKGILDRLRAVDILLDNRPDLVGRFFFVQVAAPTRSKLPAYADLQRDAIALAEAINAKHAAGGHQPIRLIVRHHEPKDVFRLFRAADICIVSSLHDGMNLVAKEFVAARDDEEGVLILSSFTGASREMPEALIVNPYDTGEMARTIERALDMPADEQHARMHLMRNQVRSRNVYRWAGRMLVDASRVRQRRRLEELTSEAA